jgi:hypothetical protein
MRELADSTRIEQFMRALGRAARVEGRDFIPLPDGWEERSPLIRTEDKISLIEPDLYRFLAIDPTSFRRSVEELFE